MSAKWTSLKLGIFTVAALVTALLVALALGVRGFHEETVPYHTYFDESVTGLELGAPVRFRGVTVGTVSNITIAADNRHVDVTAAIRPHEAPRLAWSPHRDSGLRTELASQGITGVKLVNVDFFDPEVHPAERLPFAPDRNYIPATESFLTSLTKTVGRASDRLPELTDALLAALQHLQRIFDDYDRQRLPERVSATLAGVNATMSEVKTAVARVDRARLPDKAAATLERMDSTVQTVNQILARVDGDEGLIASTQRATEKVEQLGANTATATADLDRTLRDLGDAARAFRTLADSLERDPDRLLKGPAKARSR